MLLSGNIGGAVVTVYARSWGTEKQLSRRIMSKGMMSRKMTSNWGNRDMIPGLWKPLTNRVGDENTGIVTARRFLPGDCERGQQKN